VSLTLRSAPRISAAKFKDVLAQGSSPITPIAFECYDIIAAAGLDPAILLAICKKESSLGTQGIATQTKSFGNVRTAQVPARSPVTIQGFAAYPNWRIGLIDLCDRLNLRYVFRGLDTVEKMVPIYAPASENDTQGYIAFITSHVQQWQAEEAPMTQTVGFADRTALLPLIQPNELPGPVNRTGDKLVASRSFTVHETGNQDPGATAEMHHRYWSPGGGGRTETSAHVVADELESIQLIPTDEQAWHAGDVTGNTTSLGGEICVNDRAGFPAACRRMAKFAARWLHSVGLHPVDGVTVRKHGSWPGTTHKQCPQHLNAGDWGVNWPQFVGFVQQEYALLTTSVDYAAIWGTKYVYHEGWGIEG
jgi:hypothetical protein